ncbi:hypothetical protein A9R05_42995 (plasmid) [Burkholderia sp. KK1]|nr:hypothetical protein A9R05_42995 [Burkholderia sp. KK1]
MLDDCFVYGRVIASGRNVSPIQFTAKCAIVCSLIIRNVRIIVDGADHLSTVHHDAIGYAF